MRSSIIDYTYSVLNTMDKVAKRPMLAEQSDTLGNRLVVLFTGPQPNKGVVVFAGPGFPIGMLDYFDLRLFIPLGDHAVIELSNKG